jgi:hypothetical protein
MTEIELWEKLFQDKEISYDYIGRKINKNHYKNTKIETGWMIELINPNVEASESNLNIVSIYAGNIRNGRINYIINGVEYSIRKKKGQLNSGESKYEIYSIPKNNETVQTSWEKLWENEFGDSQEGLDFSGRKVKKNKYNVMGSEYGWDVDHILPLSKEGSNSISNQQIVNVLTNDEKNNRLTFEANGKIFQVRKNKVGLPTNNIPYNYTEKEYCIVEIAYENTLVKKNIVTTAMEVWFNEFGEDTFAYDYDEIKMYRDNPNTWVVELLNPDGEKTLENCQIVSKITFEERAGRINYSIIDNVNGCEVFYRVRKNNQNMTRQEMSLYYDYSKKTHYVERYNIVFEEEEEEDE